MRETNRGKVQKLEKVFNYNYLGTVFAENWVPTTETIHNKSLTRKNSNMMIHLF